MEILHSDCCLSVHWDGFRAQHGGPEARKTMRGRPEWVPVLQLLVPGVCVQWMFAECGFCRVCCIFLLFLVQLKFPEGRTEDTTTGPRTLCVFTARFLDTPGSSPLISEVHHSAGHKSYEQRGGHRSRGRRNVPSAAVAQVCPPNKIVCSPARELSFVTEHLLLPSRRLLYR